jgi:hypothetical protein
MQAFDQRPIPNVAVTTVAGIRPIYLRAFAQAEVFAQA